MNAWMQTVVHWIAEKWVQIYSVRKSPLALVLTIVFIVQPIASTVFSFVDDVAFVRQKLDPSQRPVTKAEFDLLNAKIDTLQDMMKDDIKKDRELINGQEKSAPKANNYGQIQDTLATLQKKLDTAYVEKKK
jgi:hypothetical protein